MNILSFKTAKELENQLATQVAATLDLSIKKNGHAHLLVSGGSSPIGMFHLLSLKPIEWQKVTIGLIDERYVPTDHPFSNERLVKENLIINEAKDANFISMIYSLENEKENLEIANAHYQKFSPSLDVCILGMGEDGHTASLFPHDLASERSLLSNQHGLVSTLAPHEPKQRITCSKAMILNSDFIFLMILGETKKVVLQQSAAKKLPIAYFTEAENKVLDIYYSEKK